MSLPVPYQSNHKIGIILRIWILLTFPVYSFSQTFFNDASNPATDPGTQGTATAAIAPPASMLDGDLVIIYAHYRANGATISMSQTSGQSWTKETTANGGNQTFAIFWCRFNGTWGANPSVTVGTGTNGLSAIMYVFRPSNSSNSWAIHMGPTNSSTSNTAIPITGWTTTLPKTVTMAFWGTPASNTWGTLTGAGWSKTGLNNQYRNTSGSGQSHTGAYNIRTTAGAVANVSQTQSSSQNTRTSIVTWVELTPPANDDCATAIPLTSATTCSNTAGTVVGASYSGLTSCGGTTPVYDVWYKFTAQSVNPTITLSSVGANFNTPRLELFSGSTCGGLTSIVCNTNSIAASSLTVGNTYYVRAYSLNGSLPATNGGFNICITDPAPSNNTCSGAVTLTSGTACTNTTGYVYGATNSSPTISSPDCAGTPVYDVWYKFTAQTTNPTISLSNIGAGFTNPALQLLSNNCGSTFTPLFCGTTSIAADYLTPGTIYFIRVYSSSGTPPTSGVNAGFDICVTDPVATPPFNDECTNAVNLPIWNTCNNIPGNMAGATASSTPLGACTGPLAYDVWYKFTAINTTASITLSGIGSNFLNPRIQMFSGTCGSLTSIFCGTSPLAATGLTAGTTYYIRVYSTTAPAPNGNARFNICASTTNADVRFGTSYVNISKKNTGGVIEPGDTLEIRMTVNHTSGTMYKLRYLANIPAKTAMLTGPNDSIRIITNEGLTFRRYTVTSGDDAGSYLASPPAGQYNIRLNLGFGSSLPGTPVDNTSTESASATGSMIAGSDRPRGGGGMLFATAFRVVVTGNIGDTITMNPGQFVYRTVSTGGSDITLSSTPFNILISEPLNLCANSIGVNVASESGGTFGSGTTLNRSTDLATPIAGYTFISDVNAYNNVPDGRYAIVKNLSPRSTTSRSARRQNTCNTPTVLAANDPLNCNSRMFNGFWFVDGDHTGTNTATGNVPPGPADNSGYMLMVNADYVASEVYRQTINNLCPNTYYEFSAWIRNICPNCGLDSTGTQTYKPGVLPNLTFTLSDVDYYNSGELDTIGWTKRGFVFRTGLTQTSAVFSIRNNSQGGGGNDWALDDIAVATCLPTMSYSPTINPSVCETNPIQLSDTVSSYFKNYTTYKWQRSVNGGATWTDVTSTTTLADTNYYITNYTVPPANTTLADSGDLYRVVVATTAANLADPNCNISDGTTITLSVLDCDPVLDINLLNFNGRLINDYSNLSWTTSKEDKPYTYIIEKSTDQQHFTAIGSVSGNNNPSLETNQYAFADPSRINGKAWYRLAILAGNGGRKYSTTIRLSNSDARGFGLGNVVNPFDNRLSFEVISDQHTNIDVYLIDIFGKAVIKKTYNIYTGVNSLNLENTGTLSAGVYALRIEGRGSVITQKVIKK